MSMGSVLDPIFSNFLISDLRNKIFNSAKKKPSIHLGCVDDILVLTNDTSEISKQDTLKKIQSLILPKNPIKQ